MSKKTDEWDEYLESGYTVVLDNDGWWFTNYTEDEDGQEIWEDGGDGPYGKDLLIHLLNKHYNGVDFV